MSNLTWGEYLYAIVWGPVVGQNKPLPDAAAVQLCVTEEVLAHTKANLRPVKTRVTPKKYPSRIAHIEEMNQLAKAYRKEQREFLRPPSG